jgi:large subunit ribosomal protein L23
MEKHTGKILLSPRITEKGAYLSEHSAYVFNVAKGVSKKEIANAIQTLYKVTPRKIAVLAVPRKEVTTRNTNRKGATAKGRKAYVYLKKGETIDLA